MTLRERDSVQREVLRGLERGRIKPIFWMPSHKLEA